MDQASLLLYHYAVCVKTTINVKLVVFMNLITEIDVIQISKSKHQAYLSVYSKYMLCEENFPNYDTHHC